MIKRFRASFLCFLAAAWADWEPTNFPVNRIAGRIAVLGNRIFAVASDGLYLSTDQGLNWILTRPGSLSGPFVLAGRVYLGQSDGVYVSSDSGASFSRLGDSSNVMSVSAIAAYGMDVFAARLQVFRLNTATAVWDSLGLLPGGIGVVHSLIAVDSILYAATGGGVNGGGVYALRLGTRIWRLLNPPVATLTLQYPYLYATGSGLNRLGWGTRYGAA